MKLHSDTLAEQDIYAAAKVAGVSVWELGRIRRPRKRANGWNLYLMGSSPYRSQATGQSAATWDEHGVFMAELYKRDPGLAIAYYDSLEHFLAETRRFVESPYNREQPESKRRRGPWLADSELLRLRGA